MTRKPASVAVLLVITLFVVPFLCPETLKAEEQAIDIKAADVANSTALLTKVGYHIYKAKTQAAANYPEPFSSSNSSVVRRPTAITSVPTPASGPFFYPSDVAKKSGGLTLTATKSHPIFVNITTINPGCTVSTGACWGNPTLFLTDLGASTTMIHLVDQYTGSTLNGRYTLGLSKTVNMTVYPSVFSGVPILSDSDILTAAHSAAVSLGAGTGHLYHIFLPPNVDTCIEAFSACYSPDNGNTFVFCAYHAFATFSDLVSPVFFTVEPFQNVGGCTVATTGITPPNGVLADSTDSTLSHELFETITDPDTNNGWRAEWFPGTFSGGEIGDLCAGVFGLVSLSGHTFETQLEYSNHYHACAAAP